MKLRNNCCIRVHARFRMNDFHDTLRTLNPGNLIGKLNRLRSLSLDVGSICKRINYYNEADVVDLLSRIDRKDDAASMIAVINEKIKLERKRRNGRSVLEELQAASPLVPSFQFRERQLIDWSTLSKYLVPEIMSFGTYLAGKRKDFKGLARRIAHCARNRMQIESILGLLQNLSLGNKSVIRILDICGGRGDLALILASIFGGSHVTILDRNKLGLYQAKYRARMLGLVNVVTRPMDLFDLKLDDDEEWDIIIGLHACGQLTDIIISRFKNRCEHMFLATCCFGKMERQHKFSRYADADIGGVNSEASRLAKLIINSERCAISPENFTIFEMDEITFSSKNQIIYYRRRY